MNSLDHYSQPKKQWKPHMDNPSGLGVEVNLARVTERMWVTTEKEVKAPHGQPPEDLGTKSP